MPTLTGQLEALGIHSAWLDGEIVVWRPDGTPDFNALQNSLDSNGSENVVYFLFDVPFFDGYDLCQVQLRHRRQLLESILAIGSLILAVYKGGALVPVASVGTGWSSREATALKHNLSEIERDTPRLAKPRRPAALQVRTNRSRSQPAHSHQGQRQCRTESQMYDCDHPSRRHELKA